MRNAALTRVLCLLRPFGTTLSHSPIALGLTTISRLQPARAVQQRRTTLAVELELQRSMVEQREDSSLVE